MRLNIFDLLSVGDKELVHSSMIKLLMELRKADGSSFILERLGLVVRPYSIKKEHKVANNRFDLFFELESNNNIEEYCVIENKFKAIPSVDQLEKYKPNEKHISYSRKILFVLSKEFISESFKNQCKNNDWQLFYYFDFDENPSENDSLFGLVEMLSNNINDVKNIENDENDESGVSSSNDNVTAHYNNSVQDLKMLLIHYREHLQIYYDKLKKIIEPQTNSVVTAFKKISEINENKTFYLRNYLFYIQSKIESEDILKIFTPFNDGGTNTNPCVGFVSKEKIVSKKYKIFVEFQGHILRVGLYFDNESDYMTHIKDLKSEIRKYVFEKFHKKSGLNDKVSMENNLSVRNIKEKKSSSTMVVKYDLSELSDKFYTTENLIEDVSKLLNVIVEYDS